jgi:hypothetical protein
VVHYAALAFDLAQAMLRERTHDRTSGDGSRGIGVTPHGGKDPNFSLYL